MNNPAKPSNDLILFDPLGHEAHAEPGHPEQPARIERIKEALKSSGVWQAAAFATPLSLDEDVRHRIHHPDHWGRLHRASSSGSRFDPDTFVTSQSWEIANQTAGGAAAVAQAVWTRKAARGFALTRPPGHHATPNRAMGFCLLNNVALAAEYLLQIQAAERLAIFDFDLHHGNGTQDIFFTRDDVLYASTHQSPLYPGTGRLEEIGAGPGEGATLNLPLPPYSGDRALVESLEQVVLPVLKRFEPAMLLISAGFDAHWRDPLGHLLASAAGIGDLVARLTSWADTHCEGRIAVFLEGGYDLDASAASAQATAAALTGQTWEDPLGQAPWQERTDWEEIIMAARQIWGV